MFTTRHPRRSTAGAGLLLALALLVAACGSSSSKSSTTTTAGSQGTTAGGGLPAELQQKLEAAVDANMETYGAPGAVVAVFLPDAGSTIIERGVADTETDTPVSADMNWPLRSVTKSFTVTLILQLVDEGKISLDDPVSRYVEGVPNGDQVTIRQLANMSAGVGDYTNQAFIDAFSADPTRIFTIAELNAFSFAAPTLFPPGSEYVYVNANTNILGAVVEKVTGQPFEEVLETKILTPLELDASAYLVDAANWPAPHATGYQPSDAGLEATPDNFSIFGPAGAMVSTVEDQRTWVEALATGSLLEPATQEARLQAHPLAEGPEYDVYGLGIGELEGYWGHTGEGLGFLVLAMHNPDTGATVVIFMNISTLESGDHAPTKLFRELAAIIRDA